MTTAFLTGRASFKAAELIAKDFDVRMELDRSQRYRDDMLGVATPREKVELVWKCYIPPAITGVLAIAAIVGANRVGTRRAAALAAAYSISQTAFDEYRTKIVEKLGEKREQAARAEIAQEHVDRVPSGKAEIIFTGTGSVLCHESFTGRYFLCDMETLRKAQNDVNQQILHDSYASLGEFYVRVGLPSTAYSEEVGWNTDHLLDLQFSPVLNESGQPCVSIDYAVHPIRKYHRIG